MNTPSIEQMLKAGMHFGHHTSKWHPKMAPYIFGQRNNIHIIDLVKSRVMFTEALEILKKYAADGKQVLLVGTKQQVKTGIKQLGEDTGMPYINEKWMGGTLTNFAVIKKVIREYKDLVSDRSLGRLEKYTKKERTDMDKDIAKLEVRVGGLTNLVKLPDALFVWDVKKEKTAVMEAFKLKIPIIAICDTNTNPVMISHIVPSNDDATKTIKLVLETVKEAFLEGKKMVEQK